MFVMTRILIELPPLWFPGNESDAASERILPDGDDDTATTAAVAQRLRCTTQTNRAGAIRVWRSDLATTGSNRRELGQHEP
jgi:hypothetical protein